MVLLHIVNLNFWEKNHSVSNIVSPSKTIQSFYIMVMLGYGMTRFWSLYITFAHNCLLHFRLTTLIMWNHLINFFNFIKKTSAHKSMSNFAKPRVIKLSLRNRESFQNSLVKSQTFNFSQQAACLGEVEGVQGKVNSHFSQNNFQFWWWWWWIFPFLRYTISHELFSH